MSLPIEDLTPRQIVAELDRFIVGQNAAKKAVAVALRNRYRRQQLPAHQREDIMPKNILMIGPTGVGKTEIARRLAQLARAPFIKVEATKFTEVGYVGRDVESMIRDLVAASVRLVEKERMDEVQEEAQRRAAERLLDMLDDEPKPMRKRTVKRSEMAFFESTIFRHPFETYTTRSGDEEGDPDEEIEIEEIDEEKAAEQREDLIRRLNSGELNSRIVEIDVEEQSNPFVQVFSPQGIEEMGFDMNSLANPFGSKSSTLKVTVGEAKSVLVEEEARKMIDRSSLHRDAVHRAEQTGIIFLDEIDKVAGQHGGSGPDVSREGVQRDLLPVIEGSTVQSKFGPIRTDHILFIAAGAFHMSKPSELIPELQGRLPIRVELEPLSETDFTRILKEPENALIKQYQLLLGTEGISLTITDDGVDEIAKLASIVNSKIENIGARRLHTMMEKLLEEILFEAPEISQKQIVLDAKAVQDRMSNFVKDLDLSRYIL